MQDTGYKIRVASHKRRAANKGFTLMEMTVVIVIVALLTSLSIPAIRTFFSSLAIQGSTRSIISTALSSARAIAAREQRYAGIRFQKACNPDDPLNPFDTPQYMIFIVHDFDRTGLAPGFRAVEGIRPIKLPDDIGVMDLRLGDNHIVDDGYINEPNELRDTTTFSIIFSPSGKLVIHQVLVINREGKKYSDNSEDDIFNSESKAKDGTAMFVQDKYFSINGLTEEPSRRSFIIYEREEFRRAYDRGLACSDYLSKLKAIHINPYTGTIISVD